MMFATFTIATVTWAADNTIGTWKLNTAKSKPAPGLSPLTSETQTIEASDGGVKITVKGERADGSKVDAVNTYRYDGKPAPVTGTGLAFDTIAVTQVDANTVTEERTKQGTKYHMSARRVVSPDGKTMTITQKGSGADGKPATAVIVWDKQ
jgi:hypothetical protein